MCDRNSVEELDWKTPVELVSFSVTRLLGTGYARTTVGIGVQQFHAPVRGATTRFRTQDFRRRLHMRTARFAFVIASLLTSACASDGTSSPSIDSPITAGLSAVAAAPVGSVGDPNVTMRVSVTSALPRW